MFWWPEEGVFQATAQSTPPGIEAVVMSDAAMVHQVTGDYKCTSIGYGVRLGRELYPPRIP